ncbi:MAG: FecR family protein [Steroidobacteraceae bacterium]
MTDPFRELVQRAGRRADPPELAREAVYRATRSAWQKQRRRRVQRRQLAVAASLLGCALLAGIAWLNFGSLPLGDQRVAAVERFTGDVQLRHDSGAGRQVLPQTGAAVNVGEEIHTAPGSRLVLRRPGGILLHVAGGSELVWQTADALRLTRGLVYVDTGSAAPGSDALEILTHTGRVRHIGTRFSVQVQDLEVRVMVRDGAVAIGNTHNERRLDAGQAARIARDGELQTSTLTEDAGPWQWLAAESPRYAIEGRSLHDVLGELSLAQGEPLRYSSSATEAEARSLMLHGPALELPPLQAVDAVLLTTRFSREAPFEIVPRP